MRISFDDGYLEFQRSKKAHHIHVTVASRNPNNPLQLLVNSAEVPLTKVLKCVQSVTGPLRLDEEGKTDEKDSTKHNPDNQEPQAQEQHTEGGSPPVDRRR